MKKQLSTIAMSLALMGSFMGFSQNQKIQPCNTFAAMEEHFAAHPEARIAYEKEQAKLQKSYLEMEKNQTAGKTAAVQYTIPIVFHILHLGGAENITDAQCIAAVAQMNKDYNRLGADTGTIFAPFKTSYISSDIKFMLAHKDPNGNCTSGIEHIYDTRTNWSQSSAGGSSAYYNGIAWDPTKYLNVIIVKQIVPTGTVTGGGIIVGYTYLPGTFGSNTDLRNSIVYNYGFLAGLDARSLSHEAGHWLSLKHTFGNTNNPGVVCGSTAGGDGIADTPDTKGNFSTCPASSTNTAYTCTSPNPTNSASYYQNVENIMDYSSCPKNFTTGQTNAMRNALASSVGGRNNVVSATNLTNTDVNGLGNCAPIAEFLSTTNAYTVCAGGSLTLKDFSYNGTITSYSWSSTSGVTFGAPTASITGATFATPGTSSVTLMVTGPNGSSSKTRAVVVINAGAPIISPYSESFEGTGLPANYSITNPDNGTTWAQTSSAAYTGSKSYYIDGFSDAGGQTDYLYMPMIDILNNPNDTLTFKYAYARYSTSNSDVFKVQASKDCGGTWGDIYAPSTSGLASASGGVSTTPFAPTLNQWVHINLTNYPNWFNFSTYSTVLIRFAFTETANSSGGNNFYLDDINFSGSGTVGMKELAKSVSFGLYPNPTSAEATVKFRLDDASNIKIEVMDVVGKKVMPSTESSYTAGEHSFALNTNKTLSKGIYFVCLSVNGAKITKKLIIE